MLSELVVHNFAIIQHLEVSFQPGFNILSGETGAGKSILIGAVNLILGSRASQEMIRSGTDEATVEALFHLPKAHRLRDRLNDWGHSSTDDLLLRRTINRSGRNRIFVNNQLVTLQQLQQMTRGLVSISGQHEHQSLLDSEVHLGLLDRFGTLEALALQVSAAHAAWSKTREQLQKLRRTHQERAAQLDWMRFQLQELETARLQPDEDEILEHERNLLRHAATLRDAAQSAHECLYADRSSVLAQLAGVARNLEILGHIDPTQKSLQDDLEQARIHLEELAHAMQLYLQHISFDPQKLASIEERLNLLQRLGKKYGNSVKEMLARQKELREALSGEEDADFRENEMEKALAQLREAYLEKAHELSRRRHEASERLAEAVETALAELDMNRARFAAGLDSAMDTGNSAESHFTPTGIDRVEFLLSANPGEDLKPLAKVASGGELSRILLALKSLLSRQGEAETLIFDEVDAGIGGRTAELVGVQLKKLAEKHQVICITHLPQIACYGASHYKVAKEVSGEETATSIVALSPEDRVEELARMLGGISISEKTRAHAREFLQRAQAGIHKFG